MEIGGAGCQLLSVRSVGFAVDGLPRNETLKRGVVRWEREDRMKRYQDVFSLAPAGDDTTALFQDDILPEPKWP